MNWIDISTELPQYGQDVLVVYDNKVCIGKREKTDSQGQHFYIVGRHYCYDFKRTVTNIRHWMRLPDAPQKDKP